MQFRMHIAKYYPIIINHAFNKFPAFYGTWTSSTRSSPVHHVLNHMNAVHSPAPSVFCWKSQVPGLGSVFCLPGSFQRKRPCMRPSTFCHILDFYDESLPHDQLPRRRTTPWHLSATAYIVSPTSIIIPTQNIKFNTITRSNSQVL
jgi:hypothetical protein